MPELKTLVPVGGFQGVANSANGAVQDHGNGYRLHQMSVFATVAAALADATTIFSRLRLRLGSTLLRDTSPADLINYAALYGITAATGEVRMFFPAHG